MPGWLACRPGRRPLEIDLEVHLLLRLSAIDVDPYRSNEWAIFSDSLTLQLWKDRTEAERNPPTKGSIALEGYLGWEAGFTLDRESLTLAVVLRDAMVVGEGGDS